MICESWARLKSRGWNTSGTSASDIRAIGWPTYSIFETGRARLAEQFPRISDYFNSPELQPAGLRLIPAVGQDRIISQAGLTEKGRQRDERVLLGQVVERVEVLRVRYSDVIDARQRLSFNLLAHGLDYARGVPFAVIEHLFGQAQCAVKHGRGESFFPRKAAVP